MSRDNQFSCRQQSLTVMNHDHHPPRRQETQEHKKHASVVADHYNSRRNQTLQQRQASPIIGLKSVNNRIKSALIEHYGRPGDSVIDLACGKGGDLFKWYKARVGSYVGIDIAQGSISDCHARYNDKNWLNSSFPARLICADCFHPGLDLARELGQYIPFDFCSCQFALHYSWSSEARARHALANISAVLRTGGIFIGTMPDAHVIGDMLSQQHARGSGLTFGNRIYQIRFDENSFKALVAGESFGVQYHFRLLDAVDCPEWLVPFHSLKTLAEEQGLDLIFASHFDQFSRDFLNKTLRDQLSREEAEVASLYLTFAFRKRGPRSGRQRRR